MFPNKSTTTAYNYQNFNSNIESGRVVVIEDSFPVISETFILDQITALMDRGFNVENWALYYLDQGVCHSKVIDYGLIEKTRYLKLPGTSFMNKPAEWTYEFAQRNGLGDLATIRAFHVNYGTNFIAFEHLFQVLDAYLIVSFYGYDASKYILENGDHCYDTLFKRADLITTNTIYMMEKLIRIGCPEHKIKVIRCGVEIPANPVQLRIDNTKITLLTVARLVEKKGIEYALRALAVCSVRNKIMYRIIGDGPLNDELRHLATQLGIDDQVEFLGFLPVEKMQEEMRQADIVLLTSVTAANGDQEGLPVTLVAAQAMGLPVISSYHPGIEELVIHGVTGLLSQEREVNQIASNIQLLANDPNMRRNFGLNGRERVIAEFDKEKNIDKLARFLMDGVNDRHRRKASGVECPICGGVYDSFASYGVEPRPNALCPGCQSLERHRLLWLFLKEKTNLFTSPLLKVLDIAPVPFLSERIKRIPFIQYLSIDIHSPFAMRKMDITNLLLPDDYFDCILCYHVLEHVPNDHKAISEMYRVMKPGGWGILQVPLKPGLENTIEDLNITNPQERLRLYGNEDHVRYYGLDYKDRLESEGFTVQIDPFVHTLSECLVRRYGLQRDEEIYVSCKPSRSTKSANTDPAKTLTEKNRNEIKYWEHRLKCEGTLSNNHYQYFYTEFWKIHKSYYDGKRILDIGCGPRGSLEWADNALETVGLDPLAAEYVRLNGGKGRMTYIAAPSEQIPYPNDYFDVVCSFNSLDHVDILETTIEEIKRVVKPGGMFLLLVDVNHTPTECEPIMLNWDVVKRFEPEFEIAFKGGWGRLDDGIYDSLLQGIPCDLAHPENAAILAARFIKRPTVAMNHIDSNLLTKQNSPDANLAHSTSPSSTLAQNSGTEPFFSILTPTYNRGKYLADSIASALSQEYGLFEVVVVDDGSTDNTAEIVRSFSDSRLRYVLKEHSGAPATRNRCIAEAQGEYLLWLDSDDVLMPGILFDYVAILTKIPGIDVIYGSLQATDEKLSPIRQLTYPDWYGHNKELLGSLFCSNSVPNPATLVNKKCYEQYGNYNLNFPRAHDYEFWSRLAKSALFKHCDKIVVKWRWHDSNMSTENTNFDTKYDAMVLHGMLQMYSLQELLPTINWKKDSYNEAAATAYLIISQRLHTFKDYDGAVEYAQKAYKLVPDAGILKWLDKICLTENSNKQLLKTDPQYALSSEESLSIIAIIAAHNEGDVIYHVIGDLIANGVSVYFIDNQSTDNTIQEASRWLNRGLIHIERFPEDLGADLDYAGEYRWREILLRKEQLAAQLGADWYIHADADEFRESPWYGLTLHDAIRRVDEAGYNAIDFELYNFRPTDNSFIAGEDVRSYLTGYEPGEDFNSLQIKAWKNTGVPIDIATHGGHNITFSNRRIYPYRFILRHYPIRSQLHGIRKVFEERKKRFTREEIEGGWHLQYNEVTSRSHYFLYAKDKLKLFDPSCVRNELFQRPIEVAVFCLECPEQAYSRIRLTNIHKHFPTRIKYSFGVSTQSNNEGYLFDLALSSRADIIIISRFFPSSITSSIINDFLEFGKPVIYDVDEFFGDIPLHNPFKTLADACKPYIENLMRRASMVTVATERLKEELAPYNRNIHVLPNYLDDQLWRDISKIKKQHDSVVIGYAGWFTNKPDLELIEEALIKLSNKYGNCVVFSFMGCITDRIKTLPNCHYGEGEIDYVEYASALSRSSLDIALAPLLDSRFSQCKSSIKWLEYSACGFAGIFSNVSPYESCVENMKTGVLVENTAEKWFEAMDLLVSNPDLRQKIGKNALYKVFSEQALSFNGHRYIQTYCSLIYGNTDADYLQSADSRPAAAVVIVTYNSMTTLTACIESVARSLSPGDDVVFVDNASRDETVAMTEQLIHGLPAFQIIRNEANVGFSAATNQGILATKNPLVVLLNPDTVVPKDWLNGLSRHLCNNVAAVGPVSNYVAGLQKMELYQKDLLPSDVAIDSVAELFRKWNDGNGVETNLLIGFCMMAKREILESIGYLDEALFLGNDDLDISWRLRLAGYKLMIATDVFVYHAGQVSFSSEDNKKTKQLVQQSTDYLYKKLVKHYSPEKVPTPEKLWGIDWFKPSDRAIIEATTTSTKSAVKELTSIIILTWNQLPFTIACLESIKTNTPEPYELVIIDNGSTDGTPEWFRSQKECDRQITFIENSENRGFAAGCNQGISAAKGEYILLLNNDTIVTEGWLSGLKEILDRYPDAGVIGPMTNSASGIQVVSNVAYIDLAGLNDFAASFRGQNRYRIIRERRIVGFCMLFRHEMVEKIGLLDESFGSGNFEDDDYCLRAELAGFHNLIAGDVFIHHEGGATFSGNGINFSDAMKRNQALFKNKWDYNKLDEVTLRRLITLDVIRESRRMAVRGEVETAIEMLLQKGIRIAPDNPASYIALVDVLIDAGRYYDAIQVVSEFPPDTDPNIKRQIEAQCYAALGDDAKAKAAAEGAGHRQPKAIVVLGTLAVRQENMQQAEVLFRQAIDIDPSYSSGWLSLGMLLWSQGKSKEAWEAIKRAVTVDPLNREAVRIMVDMTKRLG